MSYFSCIYGYKQDKFLQKRKNVSFRLDISCLNWTRRFDRAEIITLIALDGIKQQDYNGIGTGGYRLRGRKTQKESA
jgi:hypothetical protein